ncbi:MAG: NCS2 family permease [Bifidobacteriaceae bacterium]|nr:NCS2 family permease [Bifidobacteriaceae bacterium]
MNSIKERLDKFFGVTQSGSSFKTEVYAGIATFLAMAYILTVNPYMLQGFGVASLSRTAALIIATAFGAIVGTVLMAVWAKMPFALAPGMGLNSMIGTILAFGGAGGLAFTYPNMMAVTFLAGLLFLAVSVVPAGKDSITGKRISLRERVFEGIPEALRTAIPVGIGLFIAFIGLQNAGVIVSADGTLVGLAKFNELPWGESARGAAVCLFGLFVIGVLSHYNVRGAIVIGVLAGTALSLPLGVAKLETIAGTGDVSWRFWENFSKFFSFGADDGAFGMLFQGGFQFPTGSLFTVIVLVITFCMISMFDTIGTVVGCATNAGLLDKDGKPKNYSQILYADSVSTITGSVFGTSTVTTFVESGAGIAVGGKTGFTSIITAAFFALAIFILPVFAFIPTAAAASALVYVGVLMISQVKNINFQDVRLAVPAFLIIIGMPLTYSITNGIGIGIVSYVVISVICYIIDRIKYARLSNKQGAEKPAWTVSAVTAVIFLLFLFYFLMPQGFGA